MDLNLRGKGWLCLDGRKAWAIGPRGSGGIRGGRSKPFCSRARQEEAV